MKFANRLMLHASNVDLHVNDMTRPEQWGASPRITNMGLHPSYDMTAILATDKAPRAVHQRWIQQGDQGREMRIVTIMRRRRQKQQAVGTASQYLGQSSAICTLLGHVGAEPNAMMRLVDDHQIPCGPLQLFQNVILLGEIKRRDA